MASKDVAYVQMDSMDEDVMSGTEENADIPASITENPPADEDYVNVQEADESPAQPQEAPESTQPSNEPAVEEKDNEQDDQPAPEPEPEPEPEAPGANAESEPATTEQTSEQKEEDQPPEPAQTEEEKPPEPTALDEEARLASEPAMMMPSTSDPTQDDDFIPRTDTAIEVEQNEPLISREETFTNETFGDENPVRKSTAQSYLSPHPEAGNDPEMELTESKRALLEEEQDGTVIRFGNYDIRYKKQREIFCSTDVTLLAVHLKEQTFEVEMDMRLFWLQPEIEEDVPFEATWSIFDDGKSLPVDPDDMFEHDTGVEWIQQEFHYHRDTKVVEWQCQFRDTFSERMELQRFPVDRQFLNMLIQGRVKPKEGNWLWIAEPPAWAPPSRFYVLRSRLGQSISDYELFAPWCDFRVIIDEDGEDNQLDEQPPFKLRLRVQRYTGYYLGNINIPMFLIVAVCLVSLVMPPDNADLANRLSVTVTSMLAGVAFRFVVSDMLPPVNYLTWMDYYVGVSFGMVSLFILENAVATIAEDTNTGDGYFVDFWFGGILIVSWVIINLFFWYACWSNVFRVPWDVMDKQDREPSELDTFQASPAEQTQGANPQNKMDDTTIKMAQLRQLSTQ